MTMATALAASSVMLRLAIYYGYPSLVEQSAGDVGRAAAVFAQYDIVVLGDGLELKNDATGDAGLQQERTRLDDLIARIHRYPRRPQIFGYVDLGSTQHL